MSVTIQSEANNDLFLNVSNQNFRTLWSAFGFNANAMGEIDPVDLLKEVDVTDPALIARETRAFSARHIEFGINEDKAVFYLEILRKLCQDAIDNECVIVWS